MGIRLNGAGQTLAGRLPGLIVCSMSDRASNAGQRTSEDESAQNWEIATEGSLPTNLRVVGWACGPRPIVTDTDDFQVLEAGLRRDPFNSDLREIVRLDPYCHPEVNGAAKLMPLIM